MSQLPNNVKILAIDIRKSYEELIKSKKLNDPKIDINSKSVRTNVRDSDDYEDDVDFDNNSDKEKKNNENEIENSPDSKFNENKINKFENATGNVEKNENNNDDIFLWNEEKAVQRVLELKDENEIRKQKEFLRWKIKKDLEIKEQEEKDVSTVRSF